MEIIYADIKGYEGIYQISTDGKVYSAKGLRGTEYAKNGYERVSLWKEGKGKHFLIHRLVAMAFIPNPDGLLIVNHKDGNKRNNHVDNLEWCDLSHNMMHAYSMGLINPHTTKVVQYTKNHKKVKEWNSISEACKNLGLHHGLVVAVCKHRRKTTGGYIWRYVNDNL